MAGGPAGGAGIMGGPAAGGMMGGTGRGMAGGIGGGAPPPPLQQPQMQGPMSPSEAPENLDCSAGLRVSTWGSVKRRFRGVLGEDTGVLASREVLTAALEGAVQELKAADAFAPNLVDECGLGKLCLQMVSMTTIEDPMALTQIFSSFEQLASPVLTLLLDVPWAVLAQAGWPVLGLLAQLNLRKGHAPEAVNNEAVDGLHDATARAFLSELKATVAAKDTAAMDKLAGDFLKQDTRESALGPLTAMAAQAVAAKPAERAPILHALQVAFRQVIGSGQELDIALGTQWPLWGLLHRAVDSLAS